MVKRLGLPHDRQSAACFFWALISLLAVSRAQAADATYPSKPVTLIIPYTTGGASDTAARVFAPIAQKYLKAPPFELENQGGNTGIPATQRVALAPPDGYTMLLGRSGNMVIAPVVDPSVPYKWDDFTYLAILERTPVICAVPADSPIQSARDLFAAIKRNPGKLSYSTSGESSINVLAVNYLLKLIGLSPKAAVPLHTKSGGEVVQVLVAGKVDFACSNATAIVQTIKDGKVRALFTNAPGHLPVLPELPNAQEAGVRDFTKVQSWSALVAPKNLPKHALERWKAALKQIAADPEWEQFNFQYGGLSAIGSQQNPKDFVAAQYRLYDELAILSGIKK